jgi:hypothetical protein
MGEKEFVDQTRAGEAHAALLSVRPMGRHHHAAPLPIRSHRNVWAVVERAYQLTFRAAELLIGRQVQAALDRLAIQHGVIFAAHDEREACQIGDDGPCSILPIQPHQGADRRKLLCLQIASDSGQRPAQFLPVASIAAVAETAEPVVAMGEAQTTVRVRTTSPRLRPV